MGLGPLVLREHQAQERRAPVQEEPSLPGRDEPQAHTQLRISQVRSPPDAGDTGGRHRLEPHGLPDACRPLVPDAVRPLLPVLLPARRAGR